MSYKRREQERLKRLHKHVKKVMNEDPVIRTQRREADAQRRYFRFLTRFMDSPAGGD